MNGPIEFFGAALILFAVHATALLTLVWTVERLGGLKHPGWAEFAWRAALFGAFFSVAIEMASWGDLIDAANPDTATAAAERGSARTQRSTAQSSQVAAVSTTASAQSGDARASASRTVSSSPSRPTTQRARTDATAFASATEPMPRARAKWEIDGDWLAAIVFAWVLGAFVSTLWIARQAVASR